MAALCDPPEGGIVRTHAAMIVSVCPLAELPPGAARVVEAGERRVAVFNVDGEVLAVDDRCAHKGGSLADGILRDGIVTCPLHWWRYDLTTGRRVASDTVAQGTYDVRITDGIVEVDLPDAGPAGSIRERLLRHAAEWKAAHEAGGPP